MPALIRATFFFEDVNKHGWTETIYNMQPTLDAVMFRAKTLVELRRNLLGTTAKLTFIRVSDDLVKRDSLIYQLPPGNQTSRSGAATGADIANASLVVRLNSTALIRRTLYMRGFPDSINVNSGQYVPDAAFNQGFDDWIAELVVGSWACRTKDQTVTFVSIAGIVQDAVTGNLTITTTAPHLFLLTTPITIKGCRGCPVVNGSYSLVSITNAQQFVIAFRSLIPVYLGGGLTGRLGYTLSAILDGEVRRISHRNAGRPFDSPVGRRRVRKRV